MLVQRFDVSSTSGTDFPIGDRFPPVSTSDIQMSCKCGTCEKSFPSIGEYCKHICPGYQGRHGHGPLAAAPGTLQKED